MPRSGCPRSLQVATFAYGLDLARQVVRLPPQSPSRYIRRAPPCAPQPRPVAPAVSKSLHSPPFRIRSAPLSGCPRSLQVATFPAWWWSPYDGVRLPPQSPSRYIPCTAASASRAGPVAPAVSKSLHSTLNDGTIHRPSGCPRSLQVATFAACTRPTRTAVRLPPQSPSRYIRHGWLYRMALRPVAPAVSKSLHSAQCSARGPGPSGCPRSLQVATFRYRRRAQPRYVRLPPQSPSRYIRPFAFIVTRSCPVAPAVSKSLHSLHRGFRVPGGSGCPRSLQVATFTPSSACSRSWGPVAPAVSKSLHSDTDADGDPLLSGCPRSLQVATFMRDVAAHRPFVRLPPQSPSRYIRPRDGARAPAGPVAPAVSKSLHSAPRACAPTPASGCPRSLQVATFTSGLQRPCPAVRLPPQSPSRYIRPRCPRSRLRSPVAPAVSKSLHSRGVGGVGSASSGCPRSLQVATFPDGLHAQRDPVRLPPQSPSRYIHVRRVGRSRRSPVAPAVSKSLHSPVCLPGVGTGSGCPRSLQVATFRSLAIPLPSHVRLPPQSPSRYIRGEPAPPPR